MLTPIQNARTKQIEKKTVQIKKAEQCYQLFSLKYFKFNAFQ